MEKAYELQDILVNLGENWFNFKEQIKSLKLESAPNIENPKLEKTLVRSQSPVKIRGGAGEK